MKKKPDQGLLADLSDEEFLLFLLQLGNMVFSAPATAALGGSAAPFSMMATYLSEKSYSPDRIVALAQQFLFDFINRMRTEEMCVRWFGSIRAAQQFIELPPFVDDRPTS